MVTGVRPWRHLSHRLHERTEDLHESIATFQMKGPDMATRVVELEKEVELLKKELTSKKEMSRFRHDINGALDGLDSALGRHEHAIEHRYQTVDERIAALEKTMTELLKSPPQGRPHMWMLSSANGLFNRLNSPTSHPSVSNGGARRMSTASSGRKPSLFVDTSTSGSTKSRRKSRVKMPRMFTHKGIFGQLLDFLLYPFSVGRTLLWGIVDFLQRHLV